MKNLIYLFLLLFSLSTTAQDATYNQWQNYVITPKYDQMQSFGEGLHEHNKMYHQDAPNTASVWRVDSGPNVGKWVLSSGPHTFADLDNSKLGAEHMAHWRNSVMPYIDAFEDGGTWRLVNDQSHFPEGDGVISKARVIVHDLSGEGGNGYYSAMKKLAQATAKGSPTTARFFLRRVGFHNDNNDRVVFIGLNKWADLENNISDVYEEVHGEGSWDIFLEEVETSINSSYEEHWVHVPYLSGSANE